MTSVTLGPGADDNPLARWLARRLRESVDRGAQAELRVLRAAVSVVAPDRRLSCTLRFDHGNVTVHDGMLGIPDVTLCADLPALEQLIDLGSEARGPLRTRLRRALVEWAGGHAKIYGLSRHPRLVLRVLRLLAGDGRDDGGCDGDAG